MARIRRSQCDTCTNLQPGAWRLGKYIRLSRDDGSSESIANQRKILDEQIGSFFHGPFEVVSEYIDDNRTGTSDDTRPEFLRLIADVKSGKINCIITKNLSRAFRNSANQGRFLEEFIPLYNTRFISLYEPHMDTFLNPEIVHSLEVSITGFMNEQYAYKTSVDVRRTLDTKRRNGEFIGAFAPYGYKKSPEDKNRLVVDEEAAETVRDIFHLFVNEGMSKRGIAGHLNGLGIPSPSAYKRHNGSKYSNPNVYTYDSLWSEKTIFNILVSETYLGNMVQGKQKVISYKVHDRISTKEAEWYIAEETHEPIIEREIFEKAGTLHRRDTRAAPAEKKVQLFSGFVFCADCKKAMTRKTARGLVYYACSTYTRKSKTLCSKHSIREDALIREVLLAVQKQVSLMPNLAEGVRAAALASPTYVKIKKIEHLKKVRQGEIKRLLNAADNLYIDWKAGEITRDEYIRMKSGFEEQRERIMTALENLKKEKQEIELEIDVKEQGLAKFAAHNHIDCLDRSLLVTLIDTIYVEESGKLKIMFNMPGR